MAKATNSAPDIPDVVDEDSLRTYLRKRPKAEAQVLALRAALRVLPLAVGKGQRSTLDVFRALVFSWAGRRYPTHEKSFSAAASNSATAFTFLSTNSATATDNAVFASASAARTAFAAADATAAAFAAAAAARAKAAALGAADSAYADTASNAVWAAIRADLACIRETSLEVCASLQLWPQGFEPTTLAIWESYFRRTLDEFGPDWRVVHAFYQALQNGRTPFSELGDMIEAVVLAIADEEETFWERDHDTVMHDLAERLLGTEALQQPEVLPNKATEKVDFFISYSTGNEAEAREINGYLEDAGYSTIVQFKDFAVGSNFVIEMQEALERGARAIVLLSPDYVASDHCCAELAAIYNMDPLGKDRKLVPLLLKPASLNKLARQIVYKSLFGLKVEERRAAVLEAIGHRSEPLLTDILKRRLAETASPDVAPTTDGKLDAVPNPVYDRPVLDADLPDLPEVLKSLCRVIKSSLPDNSPRAVAPTLQEYSDHISERGMRPIVNLLCMLADALKRDVRSVEFDVWGDGLSTHFESFFSFHSQFITHFPKAQEREEIIASNAMDEDKASGKDFVAPVEKVAVVLNELHLIGGTTPAFERVVQGSLQTAKDIDSLPMDPDMGQQGKITPKRRFVFAQIGFWERILSALGSMTTLATTEQGRAAIAALSEAIKKFLSFISSN